MPHDSARSATALPDLSGPDARPPRLLGVFAHPDDETFCAGGAFARYAALGAEILVVSATRGQAGQIRDASVGTRRTIGAVREAELREACAHLGVGEVRCWDHLDGAMADADFTALVGEVVQVIREFRPDIVITFGPDGGYGHPDHIAISNATTEACRQSGSTDRYPEQLDAGLAPFEPYRLYHAHFPPHDVLLLEHLATWLTSQTDHFAGTLDFAHSLLLMAEEAGTMGFIRDNYQVRWYPPGCFVVEQGESGRELFLILSGIARVVQEAEDGTRSTLRTLGAGEFFGELGVASQHTRSAHVIAHEGLTCLVFAPDAPTLFAGRGEGARLVGADQPGQAGAGDAPATLAELSPAVAARLDVRATVPAKVAALSAYRSQFPLDPHAYPDFLLEALFGQEYFIQAHPPRTPSPELF